MVLPQETLQVIYDSRDTFLGWLARGRPEMSPDPYYQKNFKSRTCTYRDPNRSPSTVHANWDSTLWSLVIGRVRGIGSDRSCFELLIQPVTGGLRVSGSMGDVLVGLLDEHHREIPLGLEMFDGRNRTCLRGLINLIEKSNLHSTKQDIVFSFPRNAKFAITAFLDTQWRDSLATTLPLVIKEQRPVRNRM